MAAPNYTPTGGRGSTYKDNSGATFRFDGKLWQQIGSGVNQNQSYQPQTNQAILGAQAPIPSSGGVPSAPAVPSNPNPTPSGPSSQDINAEIDNMFNSQNDYLNQAEGQLKADFPNVLQEAETAFNTSKSTLDTSKEQTGRLLSEQELQAQTRKEDALSQATRLYNELMRSGQQRFGGASSAGQAYTELNAAEQQRRAGDITKDYSTAAREIENQRVSVEENYKNGILQLQQQKQIAINQAQRDFQNKLLEISRLRGEAAGNRSAMRLAELQNLRNQVFQIETENRQFQQALDAQKAAADLELRSRMGQFSSSSNLGEQAVNTYNQNTTTNPTTDNVISYGATNTATTPTGYLRRKDDQYA